ncbi:MAG: hypothetical protein IPL71_24180 [Anaerolineales bacterium]|uniref:hypothetical protein n=1 Tax=Candidatus Villigracilis proximus TaxID=3140683 RepID=UPI003134A24D|nr:hypothetical protein [Anaerolineales bacterium]
MIFTRLKLKMGKWLPGKRKEQYKYDFTNDINKNFKKFVDVNEQYFLVAHKFFSTSLQEDENSLRKSAEDVVAAYKTVELFTLYERVNFFHQSTDKITANLDQIAELMFWIDKRDKSVVANIEKSREEHGDTITSIFYAHIPLENTFLNLVMGYTTGLSVIMSYFKYIVKQSFTDVSLPSAIEDFYNRYKYSKLWLVLPFIGLALTIIGFIPIVSVATGVLGLIMFYVENCILAGKELRNLKKMPEVAAKAKEELHVIKLKIDVLRVTKDFVVNWMLICQLLLLKYWTK